MAPWKSARMLNWFPPGIPCIAPDGSMSNADDNLSVVANWINGVNAYQGTGWLGRQDWQLPPDTDRCAMNADKRCISYQRLSAFICGQTGFALSSRPLVES